MLNDNVTLTLNNSTVLMDAIDAIARQIATPRPGPLAWTRIKSASKMLRDDWRIVGLDLLEGRKLHPSNIAFGQWCRAEGYGDMHRNDRTAAIWMVENWETVVAWVTCNGITLNNPQEIRRAYLAHLAGTVEPEETDEPAPAIQAPPKPALTAPWDGELTISLPTPPSPSAPTPSPFPPAPQPPATPRPTPPARPPSPEPDYENYVTHWSAESPATLLSTVASTFVGHEDRTDDSIAAEMFPHLLSKNCSKAEMERVARIIQRVLALY